MHPSGWAHLGNSSKQASTSQRLTKSRFYFLFTQSLLTIVNSQRQSTLGNDSGILALPFLSLHCLRTWGSTERSWRRVTCSPLRGLPPPSSFYTEILQQLVLCYVLSHFGRVQLFATPVDCSLPGSSVLEILQARMLKWKNMPSSRGSSWPRDWTCISYVSCIGRQVLYHSRHLLAVSKFLGCSSSWSPHYPWPAVSWWLPSHLPNPQSLPQRCPIVDADGSSLAYGCDHTIAPFGFWRPAMPHFFLSWDKFHTETP